MYNIMYKRIYLEVLLQVIFCLITFGSADVDLSQFNSCCTICRGNQDLWIENNPDASWALTVEGEKVYDFRLPAAYYMDESITSDVVFYNRRYNLSYSGIPVLVKETVISEYVLQTQYVQLNLTIDSYVAGVTVQGGHYEDVENDLFYGHFTWVTQFAVSYSTDGQIFQWLRDETGHISVFVGLTAETQYKMQDLGQVIATRFVRIHPIGANNEQGATELLMIRIGVITCSSETVCIQQRYPCVLNTWEEWSQCVCDWARCRQTRTRSVASYPACGGESCGGKIQTKPCTLPEPAWKSAMMIVGIILPIVVVAVIILIFVYKIKSAKKKPEVFIRTTNPVAKKEKKERKLRKDKTDEEISDSKIEEANDDEELSEFLEREIAPGNKKKKAIIVNEPNLNGDKELDTIEEELARDIIKVKESDSEPKDNEIDQLEEEISRTAIPQDSIDVKDGNQPKTNSELLGKLDAAKMTVVGIDGHQIQKKKKKKKTKQPDLLPITDQVRGLPALKETSSGPSNPAPLLSNTFSIPPPPVATNRFGSDEVDEFAATTIESMPPVHEENLSWDSLEAEFGKEKPSQYDHDIFDL